MQKRDWVSCDFGIMLFQGGFKKIEGLSFEKYQSYERAVEYLEDFCEKEQILFATVKGNYEALQKAVNDHVRAAPAAFLQEMRNPRRSHLFVPENLRQRWEQALEKKLKRPPASKNRSLRALRKKGRLEFNRCLVNFLNSFRIYLKQSEMGFKKEFGKGSTPGAPRTRRNCGSSLNPSISALTWMRP
ncbi:MAG: hypothetical protein KF802_10585 [Bdellovibrionaceae bacterium]|nr:hypothetical protein [Pseudobdellovibrionaceae bacterium]